MRIHLLPLIALQFIFAVHVRAAALEPPVLRVSLENEPPSLDWNAHRQASDRFLVSFLMRGMMKYDATSKPVCDLCSKVDVTPDAKTYTFELRAAEKWSDGVALQAQHFVDSFDRLLSKANHFPAAADFHSIAAVRAIDAAHLEIRLSRPELGFLFLLTTSPSFPIRKELLKGAQDLGERHASTAVLGPYQLAEWNRGKRLVIEGNPRYAGERPVYRVDFVLGAHEALVEKFRAGRLDILASPTTEDLVKLPGQGMQVSPYWATRLLLMNLRGKLADSKLRTALLFSVDRDALPSFLKNGERRATGLIPPGLPGYRPIPLASPDLPRALSERQGLAPVKLQLILRDSRVNREVTKWLGEQWARISVTLDPRALSSVDYERALESGGYDLALQTFAFDVANPLDLLALFKTGGPANFGAWTNVSYDAWLEQAARARDGDQVAPFLEQLTQQVEIKNPGVIPLGFPTQPFLLGARVQSFAVTPFGDPDLVKIQLKK